MAVIVKNYDRSRSNFRTRMSGDWDNYLTWEIKNEDGTWEVCPFYPQAGNDVLIQIGHTVTLTQDESAKTVLINGTVDYDGFDIIVDLDSDVSAYQTRVNSAGGAIGSTELLALDFLIKEIKDIVTWSEIVDFWLPLGGTINSAICKIKYPSTLSTMLNNGATAFVDDNYSASLGVTSTATGRKLSTQITPTSEGLSNNDFAVIIGVTDNGNTSNGGIMFDNKESGGAGIYFTKSSIGLNGGAQQSLYAFAQGQPMFLSQSSNGTLRQRVNWKDLVLPAAVTSVTLDSELSLFGGRSFGATQNCVASIGFYLCSKYLTVTQNDAIITLVNNFFITIGRASVTKDCVVYGDSNTFGTGPSVFSNRYSYQLAAALGLKERNLGIGGSGYRANGSTTPGGYPNRADIFNYNILDGGYVFIMYGLNDMRTDTGSGSNFGDLETKMITQINELLSFGMDASKIVVLGNIINNEAGNSSTKKNNYVQAQANAASTTGVVFVDLQAYLTANGGTSNLVGDNVHLSNLGSTNVVAAIMDVLFP